ncbi:MAG: hypothetical protein R6V05_15060 [Candidatus Brocadiia bacterium]
MELSEDDPRFSFAEAGGFKKTSDRDARYNCIGWAAGEQRWWEPDSACQYYWPPGVPREYTVCAYVEVFRSLGYQVCSDVSFEQGFEKVAIFSRGDTPTHAARQATGGANAGKWTSKMGKNIDVLHQLQGATGELYGNVAAVLKRPIPEHTST